jgi:hypothetical protein
MDKIALAVAVCFLTSGIVYAQTPPAATLAPSCKSQATDKKLAGAAFNSFMKKCQIDAAATCDTAAADKKLAGAAKTSFLKKCVNDASGT